MVRFFISTAAGAVIGAGSNALFGCVGAASLGHNVITSVESMVIGGTLLWGAYGALLGCLPQRGGKIVSGVLNGSCFFNETGEYTRGRLLLEGSIQMAFSLAFYTITSIISGLLGYAFLHVRNETTLSLGEQVAASSVGAMEVVGSIVGLVYFATLAKYINGRLCQKTSPATYSGESFFLRDSYSHLHLPEKNTATNYRSASQTIDLVF